MSFLLVPKTSANNDLSAAEYTKTDRVTLKESNWNALSITSEVARRKTASIVGFAGTLFITVILISPFEMARDLGDLQSRLRQMTDVSLRLWVFHNREWADKNFTK